MKNLLQLVHVITHTCTDFANEALARSPSVMIKVRQGKSYADVLGKLRKEVNPDTLGSSVVSARATQ